MEEPEAIDGPKPISFNNIDLDYNQPIEQMKFVEKGKKGKEYRNAPIELNYQPEQASLYTLKNVVSSKNARDIVRSVNFMPGQFDLWNANKKGGNNKYKGSFQDLDGDEIAEYVVTRDGKIVAINGYTTKRSDFPFKAEYYRTHPTSDDRKREKYNEFLNKYYGPEYSQDGSAITRWQGIDPTTEEFKKKFKLHNTHQPRPLSTYQAFSKYIMKEACKAAFKKLGDNKEEKIKIARKIAGVALQQKMVEAFLTKIIYTSVVRVKIEEKLQEDGDL